MKNIFYSFIILFLFSTNVHIVYAQTPANCVAGEGEYCLLEPLPCIEGAGTICEQGKTTPKISFQDYVGYVFKLALAAAVFLAVIVIIYSGFEYMLSGASITSKETAKKRIQSATQGLVGVFVSYLILQTVDPRLVRIETTIPKIDIVLDRSVMYFQNILERDLRNLSNERRETVINLEIKKLSTESEIRELQKKLDNREITDDEYKRAILIKNQERANIMVAQTKALADGIGISNYRLAQQSIFDPSKNATKDTVTSIENFNQYTNTRVENVLINDKYPTGTTNVIQNSYNEKINAIIAINPKTQDNYDAINNLSKQRDFYISQIKEDVDTKEHFTNSIGNPSLIEYVAYKAKRALNSNYLTNRLNEYKANLSDPKKSLGSGIPDDQYKEIMTTRIMEISNELEIKY